MTDNPNEWNVTLRARIEALTAERDKDYANGYRDAETEISKSALGQRNAFLHAQYANAADHIKALQAECDKYEAAWMTAEGKLADAEAENERLREELELYPLDKPQLTEAEFRAVMGILWKLSTVTRITTPERLTHD